MHNLPGILEHVQHVGPRYGTQRLARIARIRHLKGKERLGLKKLPPKRRSLWGSLGGRWRVRTADLFGVNEARYHCANRPSGH